MGEITFFLDAVGEITKLADMVGEITKEEDLGVVGDDDRSPLLPERHPSTDLFVVDILDAAPKGDMASMEHPIFSLSTKPDFRQRRYEHNGQFIEIRPSNDGLATVHDRDVLIFCISRAMALRNEGRPVEQVVKIKAYDLLVATNRVTDGRGYEGLKAALRRLQGTQIETNITTGGEEQLDIFSLVDRARVVRETREGRMQEIEIKLSDWVMNAIRANEVLTLHRNYFRLRKPLERRMYELARKHCGKKREWRLGLELLQKKCGSNSTLKEFRRLVGAIVEHDQKHQHFPDYSIAFEDDVILFKNRETMPEKMRLTPPAAVEEGVSEPEAEFPPISPDTFAEARKAAPGYDVYWLHEEFRSFWLDSGKPELKNPDKAFIGFCRKRSERAPMR
ncbi:replication initiator protein A [Ancylobacter sonchi]|uniref:replication initiator protein A n=1 Tax=Ancylobacter sonchi TaxID=1937790 RepID=UPI001BD437DA|nr:replication initiator protein A [Ancylobacter sonchi]MBS7532317.1 replication initiator protein A [Ancylobacter sonchi]